VELGLAGDPCLVVVLLLERRKVLLVAPPAQAAQQRAARLALARGDRDVAGDGLADPPLLLGARAAQLADEAAGAAGRQVGLRPLALQDRAAADLALDVVLDGAELLDHGSPLG
jgi:hypothetical protein